MLASALSEGETDGIVTRLEMLDASKLIAHFPILSHHRPEPERAGVHQAFNRMIKPDRADKV